MKKNLFCRQIGNQTVPVIVFILLIALMAGCSTNNVSHVVSVSDNVYIVNINARTATRKNPVSVELKAGTYNIDVIGMAEGGAYDAWKPWFYKAKKNNKGEWVIGWINKYSFSSDEFAEETCTDGIIYETPSLALANAINSQFTLRNTAIVNFYIIDSPNIDNSGGISLRITPGLMNDYP